MLIIRTRLQALFQDKNIEKRLKYTQLLDSILFSYVYQGIMQLLHVSWYEAQLLSEELADKIVCSGFQPDLIIAISRGGFHPARILCDQLDFKRLASMQVEYYKGIGETNEEPQIVFPVNADVKDLTLLVVDDVADTGGSLLAVKEYLCRLGAKDSRVATLHYKPMSVYEPDFYVRKTQSWIVYPWEPKEAILGICSKLTAEEEFGEEELIKKLIELGFKRREIRRYLNL
jgi:hypoxanthine phosphoribosyltransferase